MTSPLESNLFSLKSYPSWPCWVFIAARGLPAVASPVAEHWLRLLPGLQQSWCTGLVATRHVGSSRIKNEPVSPALAGGLFVTEPPGNPREQFGLKKKKKAILLAGLTGGRHIEAKV